MKKTILIILSICLILLFDNFSDYAQTRNNPDGFEKLYRSAIANAIYPETGKISSNLIAISKSTPGLVWKTIKNENYVLVVSWVKDTSIFYKAFRKNGHFTTDSTHIMWVTVIPEVRNVCMRNGDNGLRLEQRLGLPPSGDKRLFIQFWVKPSDLFRPCPDNEITDKVCQLCFPSNPDPGYTSWFNSWRIDAYHKCDKNGQFDLYSTYPWTQLGYTYDWNPDNKSHVGLSEFIIWKNKNIIIDTCYQTEDYCRKKK
jgi:hypothetical protein